MSSIRSQLIRNFLKQMSQRRGGNGSPSLAAQRASLDRMGGQTSVPRGTVVEKAAFGGVPGELIRPKKLADHSPIILYLHGGGYCFGSCTSHRGLAAHLATAAQARVALLDYHLAPEHPYPAAVFDACAAYRNLIADGTPAHQIVIGGDSAGGGLTLATMLALRDAGDPLPAAGLLISPWTDLAATGESVRSRADDDPWLQPHQLKTIARLYHGDYAADHPGVSPLYADLSDLPPLIVHVGELEILYSDSERLVERARAAGVDVTFKEWEGMWHVWHAFLDVVPEGKAAIVELAEFANEKINRPIPVSAAAP